MKNFTFPFKNKIKKSNPKAGFLINSNNTIIISDL